MSQEKKNAEFDEEWNAFGASVVVPARGGNNDKFKPEVGKVYDRIAILREPSWEIPSKNPTWAPSVAVNIVNLRDGNRMDSVVCFYFIKWKKQHLPRPPIRYA